MPEGRQSVAQSTANEDAFVMCTGKSVCMTCSPLCGQKARAALDRESGPFFCTNLFSDARDSITKGWFAEHLYLEKQRSAARSTTLPGSRMHAGSTGNPGNVSLVDATKTPTSRSQTVVARATD